MDLYSKLNPAFQNILCSAYGFREKRVRFGKNFKKHFENIVESEFETSENIERKSKYMISNTLKNAYHLSPYYHKLFINNGITYSDLEADDILARIPIQNKEIINNNYKQITSKNLYKLKTRKVKTSGSTGTAFEFPRTTDSIAFQWAVWWRSRRRFGFINGNWHVNFTGKPVVPISFNYPPYWRIDFSRKQIIICLTQLTREKIRTIVDFLNQAKISYYTGYPSLIAQFCSLIEHENIHLRFKPSLIFLGGEKCHDFQREIIFRVTKSLITDQYGLAEGCCNASRCDHGNYHVDWEFGKMECVDGISNPDGSITGKIAATGFSNFAFPFIRYLTGDVATWASKDFKCGCGRSSRVIFDIEGRNEDYIFTSDGNKFMRFDYLFKETKGIKEAQIIQKEIDKITIRYVPRKTLSDSDFNKIIHITKTWISPLIEISFEEVNEIKKTKNGKFKAIVSELKKNNFQSISFS